MKYCQNVLLESGWNKALRLKKKKAPEYQTQIYKMSQNAHPDPT